MSAIDTCFVKDVAEILGNDPAIIERLLLDSRLVSSRNYSSMVFQESFIGNIFINQFDMDSCFRRNDG